MNILYVSQYYPPEMGAPAARASELAHHWAEQGHQVSILTGFPNHPTGVVPPEWRPRLRRLTYHEESGGVDVYRTWLWPLPNRKAHERMRNYASFFLSSAVRGLALPRPDVIIGSSPQLLVALSAYWISFARRVPFIFEVRDLWPESLVAVGVGREDSALHRGLAAIAKFLYQQSDRIVVVSPAFKDYLIEHWQVPAGRIDIVENGVETELFTPCSAGQRVKLRQQLGAESRVLVCYIGTLGMAHGLETLLDAAARLQAENPDVLFLLIGEGAEKGRIQSLAQSRNLSNVRFMDQQPHENIPALISVSDACLVLLKKSGIFKTVIPTKMLEFMSCARPVILAVEGQAQRIVEEAGCGLVIEPENADALADSIRRLAADPQLGNALGLRGRNYILGNFSRAATAEKYIRLMERVVKGGPPLQS